jgi:hypothetical protein
LVLEWAEEAEQDLDVLRQKAGVGFGGGKDMPGRKRKLDLGKKGADKDPVAVILVLVLIVFARPFYFPWNSMAR